MNRLSILLSLAIFLISVEAGNQTCLDECRGRVQGTPYNPSCCNCCGSTATCNGNAMFSTCCGPDENFCGCIASRGFCSGSAPGFQAESTFGTCYPKNSQRTCSYSASSSVWVLCPADTTACIAGSMGSCCTSGQVCNQFYGYCESPPANATSTPPATSSSQSTGALCNGQAYDSKAYTCTTNEQGKQVLCSTGSQSCGNACYSPSSYCCQNGQLTQKSQCGSQASQKTSAAATSATSPATSATSNPTPSSSPSTTQTCDGQAYDNKAYTCATNEQGKQVLCPAGHSACGRACFKTSDYCCKTGQLKPLGQC